MGKTAIFASVLVLGVIIGLGAVAWPPTFERKIDVSDLLNLLISLALFLGLNILFVRQQGRERAQKDHLIDLANRAMQAAYDLDAVLLDVKPLLVLSEPARLRVQVGFQRYSNAVYLLCRALELRKLYDRVDGAKLKQDESDYREVVLGEPFPEQYEATQVRQQKGRHKTVCDHIIEVIFALNEL